MKLENLNRAIREAQKFLTRAKEVAVDSRNDSYIFFGNKKTGALRRQSMELTRALAELRKP